MAEDTYVCPICHVKVKRKLEKAHKVSKDHKKRLISLKQVQEKQQKLEELKRREDAERLAQKRQADSDEEDDDGPSVSSKRSKPEEIHAPSLAAMAAEPDKDETEVANALPSDFFENRTDEEKKATNLDEEFDKFMSEVKQIDRKEIEAAEIEDEADAVRKDIDMIDEQIEMWRKMNELEKQKDSMIAEAKERTANEETSAAYGEDEDGDESDDDGSEFDIYGIDWRARRVSLKKDFELECSQTAKFHRKDSLKPEEETTPFKFHVEWLFPKLMSTSKR
ncbi:unnamed protein product [Bursaphelenchus xylophilus]|nr:unnamed protein product [Bursaphelenchus xylophilus]CAG9125261.1 unnamed protein product [Bursaphelenchus xylophilus]